MNKLLGDIEIEIGGVKHRLKPTFEGLILIEEKSKKTLSELVGVFIKAKPGLGDVVAVIYGGMYGANSNSEPSMSYEQLGNSIMTHGFAHLMGPCATLVASAYTGKPIDQSLQGRELKKEPSQDVAKDEKKTEG